jgi:hypothetical protein
MRIASVLLCVLCAVFVSTHVFGADIVWITEDTPNFTDPPPDPLVPGFDLSVQNLLTDAGYDVTRMVNVLDLPDTNATEFKEMEAADLVIVSRDTNSGNYDDVEFGVDEPTTWNSISTPLIQTSSYLIRSSRWLWFNNTGNPTVASGASMEAIEPDHPIFTGIPLDGNNQIVAHDPALIPDDPDGDPAIPEDLINLTEQTDAGNGELLAVDPATGNVWVAHFEAGTEFYSGSGQTPVGDRLWFAGGSNQDATSKGGLNYTADAQQTFLNAVAFMLGEEFSPTLLGDVNLDEEVNGLDVDPFVGLVTSGTYQDEGDMNGDGEVNGLDVDPFVEAVVGGGVAAVPEPSALLLTLAALGILGAWRRKR